MATASAGRHGDVARALHRTTEVPVIAPAVPIAAHAGTATHHPVVRRDGVLRRLP